jgi:hypothetical protein
MPGPVAIDLPSQDGTPPSAVTHAYDGCPFGTGDITIEQDCVAVSQLSGPQLNG